MVIYDGLLEEHEYVKLARAMGSRGRKVLVVGSTYTIEDKKSRRPRHAQRSISHVFTLQVGWTRTSEDHC